MKRPAYLGIQGSFERKDFASLRKPTSAQECLKVWRQRAGQHEGFASDWVNQAQFGGVQKLTRQIAPAVVGRAAIAGITEERMAQMGEVQADLVRAARVKHRRHEGGVG